MKHAKQTKHTYAVFGLGHYGQSVARALAAGGAEVLAVDTDESIVNTLAVDIPLCKCADVTDPEVIRRLDIGSFHTVIIAMATNLEASIMATMLCKEAGVQTVIAKCSEEMHRRILLRVGADRVVFPEREAGARLAQNLLSAGFVDMVELSHELSIVEVDVQAGWVGKNLIELNLRRRYEINVIAVREGADVRINMDPEQPLNENMKLIVIAKTAKLSKLNA